MGLAGTQFFSDDNRRDHGRLRLIYQPSLDLGLTLQARYRMYRSSEEDVGREYFNPEDYQESMLALGWRQRFAGWSAGLTAGLGREKSIRIRVSLPDYSNLTYKVLFVARNFCG